MVGRTRLLDRGVFVSRKDLSRTVIEGGRRYHNGWERRQSHGDERAAIRAWLQCCAADEDAVEATAPPRRRRVYKAFHDKLAPAKRWLAAQVGRPWNKVYAELRAKFDARTIAGAHVVNDHMLRWVERGDASTLAFHDRYFVVDAHGILRKSPYYGLSWARLRKNAEALARGRRAAATHMGWWWFRVEGSGAACRDFRCVEHHDVLASQRYHATRLIPDQAMTRGERRQLDRLYWYLRDRIVVADPWAALTRGGEATRREG